MLRVQIFTCFLIPLSAAPLARPYTVENYDVAIQVDLARQRLSGTAAIRLHGNSDTSAVELDAGGALQINSVMEGQYPQSFEHNHGKLFIVLTNCFRSARCNGCRHLAARFARGTELVWVRRRRLGS
jgi:hypothetical protein